MKTKKKFSKFQIAEPDCKGRIGPFVVTVYNLSSRRPKIAYAISDIPSEIKTAVKIWVKHMKYGGMSLTDYLNAIFDAANYNEE